MTTLSTIPAYPIPKRDVQVIFTIGGAGANFVRAWATVAPTGSELDGKLKASTHSRVVVYEGDGGASNPWRFTPDKGGKYTIVVQEYTKGSSYGGGYDGDPNGAPSETQVGSESTLSLYIGQRMTQKIGAAPDTATLVVWVWNATIRATTLATHGEKTPSITSQGPTAKAKAAMESSAVSTALAALIDVSASTALGTLSTIVSNMQTKINGHDHLGASTHNAADTDNDILAENASAPSPATLSAFVNDALTKMRRHRLNDSGSAGGTGSASYHQISSVNVADFTNMPLYQSVGSLEEAYGALADIWRAHEGHRVNLSVHGASDTGNSLTALPAILEVHRQFLAVVAALSPTVPPAQSTAAVAMVSTAGFAEG